MAKITCPRCNKKFKTQANLLQHMNQPTSACLIQYRGSLEVLQARQQKRPHEQAFPGHYRQTGDLKRRALDRDQERPGAEGWPDQGPNVMPFQFYEADILTLNDPTGSNTCAAEILDSPSDVMQPSPFFIKTYLGAAATYGEGTSFMQRFEEDLHADKRQQPGYSHFSFASKAEWEMASYLLRSGLSQAKINEYLTLSLTQGMNLSFKSAGDLRSRAEILPPGPLWKSKIWKAEAPTKQKTLTLFYRDPIECLQSLMRDPLIKDHIQYSPFQIFKDTEHKLRVYTEWLSGNQAWNLQTHYPPGATILGAILSSDKTTISQMTGNRVAHPVLISLANINMEFRMKGSNRAFMLLALLPVPRFIHPTDRLRGVLADRLFHDCLNFVLEPLKVVARIGTMMTDALANRRYCFTPLAAYIVDTPESQLISGVSKGCLSITTAAQRNFGDDFRHPSRTAAFTLKVLHNLRSQVDPSDFEAYWKISSEVKYNGVDRPFWVDWALSDPSIFLTSEPLHHWHKEFWDHDAKWCITAVGAGEIDFRFSILQPHTGLRHFKEGISTLKQVTGREHREIERWILAVIVGAVPSKFLLAIRALMDFRYLAQSMEIDEDTCRKIETALKDFHDNKQAVVDTGGRTNKQGKIKPWHITKLEFLQSVAWNIRLNGIAQQWSADGTERAHIDVIKIPSENTNNHQYESQIVRHLDRAEKCRLFDLATAMKEAGVDHAQGSDSESDSDETAEIGLAAAGTKRQDANYFAKSQFLQSISRSSAPQRPTNFLRTFSVAETAYHLNRKPAFAKLAITDVSVQFCIPDLHAALCDYIQRTSQSQTGHISVIGGRRTSSPHDLPFSSVAVWTKVRIQNKSYHWPHSVLPSRAINAVPPGKIEDWEYGRYDTVIANFDPKFSWPHSGLQGHQVVELRLIFRIIAGKDKPLPFGCDRFLTYVHRYDIVPQVNKAISGSTRAGIYPDADSSLFLLRRALRANNDIVGDILPLDQVRTPVDLVPKFGDKANRRLSAYNSRHFCSDFWLNKYFDKEMYLALSSC